MARLSKFKLDKINKKGFLLGLLFRQVRNIQDAENELRWIKEEFKLKYPNSWQKKVFDGCYKRGILGMPLQYILGNVPFGNLEIICREGTLIPRSETEGWVYDLTNLLNLNVGKDNKNIENVEFFSNVKNKKNIKSFTVLDLCSGTGCIPLYMANNINLSEKCLFIGIDICKKSIELAKLNYKKNYELIHKKNFINFMEGDLFDYGLKDKINKKISTPIQLITANPPYILPKDYILNTEKSVRKWEPRRALVGGNEFPLRILKLAEELGTVKGIVIELCGESQVDEIQKLINYNYWTGSIKMKDIYGIKRCLVLWKEDWDFLKQLENN